jgi:hypothetical protein
LSPVITSDNEVESRPVGSSEQAAICRLRKDRPARGLSQRFGPTMYPKRQSAKKITPSLQMNRKK